jgi:hypothetical protein
MSENVGTSKHAGGNRVSTISLFGCGTSVALTMDPTDDDEEEEEEEGPNTVITTSVYAIPRIYRSVKYSLLPSSYCSYCKPVRKCKVW